MKHSANTLSYINVNKSICDTIFYVTYLLIVHNTIPTDGACQVDISKKVLAIENMFLKACLLIDAVLKEFYTNLAMAMLTGWKLGMK